MKRSSVCSRGTIIETISWLRAKNDNTHAAAIPNPGFQNSLSWVFENFEAESVFEKANTIK